MRSTGTPHRATAYAIERMAHLLWARRRWDLLDAVEDGRITLATLYDAYSANELDVLSDLLDDRALSDELAAWHGYLESQGIAAKTMEGYERATRAYLRRYPNTYGLTAGNVREWLDKMTVSSTTRNNYLIGLSSFVKYLVEVKAIDRDPLVGLKRPKPKPARTAYLELVDVQRLLSVVKSPYDQLFRFMYATGVERSAAVGVRVADVDRKTWLVRAAGTKAHNRDRSVIVMHWARQELEPLLERSGSAMLFEGVNANGATVQHRAACTALGLNVTLHDARHHWAVRALRSGWPVEAVSRQLGHADARMVLTIYGRFVPDPDQLERWALLTQRWDQEVAEAQPGRTARAAAAPA